MRIKSRHVAYTVLVLAAVAVAFSAVSGAQVDGTSEPQTVDRNGNETLEQVTGTLKEGEDGDYRLDGLEVDIGARWYVEDAEAPADFDGDAGVETVAEEFDGMVGREVTLTVEREDEEVDVHAVDGVSYRGDGPPPWAGGPDRAGVDERREHNGSGPPPWAGGPSRVGGDRDTEDDEERRGGPPPGPPPWAGGPDR